jgi:hypothetical protein
MEDDAVRKQFLRVTQTYIYLVWSAPWFGLVHFLFLLRALCNITADFPCGVVWFGTFPVFTNPRALRNISASQLIFSVAGFGLVHFLFLLILVHCVTSQLIFS